MSQAFVTTVVATNAVLSGVGIPWMIKVVRLRWRDDAILGGPWGGLSYLFMMFGVCVSYVWRIATHTASLSPGTFLVTLGLVFNIVFMFGALRRAHGGKPLHGSRE